MSTHLSSFFPLLPPPPQKYNYYYYYNMINPVFNFNSNNQTTGNLSFSFSQGQFPLQIPYQAFLSKYTPLNTFMNQIHNNREPFTTWNNKISNPAYTFNPFMTLFQSAKNFVSTFSNNDTQDAYTAGFNQLFKQGFLNPAMTLAEFACLNLELKLDEIRQTLMNGHDLSKDSSESCRQSRAALFVSYTSYLARLSGSLIRKAVIQKNGAHKTYSHAKVKTTTDILTPTQIEIFFQALKEIGQEQYLFAYIQLHSCRRVSEVCELKVGDIDFEQLKIVFLPKKKRGVIVQPISIYFLQEFMVKLQTFITLKQKQKGDYLFTTKTNVHIERSRVKCWYKKAWKLAAPSDPLPKGLTHNLRATGINYAVKKEGLDSGRVMEISGHCKLDMVFYYKKFSHELNVTKTLAPLAPLL